MTQIDLFSTTEADNNYVLQPRLLPEPVNDWALAIYILLCTPKGVTVLDANGKWGMVKFQERLNETLKIHPEIASKKKVSVRKRLNRKVEVMLYTVADKQKALDIYFSLNKKNGSKEIKTTQNDNHSD